MGREYLVDAWFLIALFDPRDGHHRRAQRLRDSLRSSVLVTHDSVLTEVLAYFSDEGSHMRTVAAIGVREILWRHRVLSVDRPLLLRALDLYESRPDKEYSLTDCISMQVMRDRGITHVLTNDHHFSQEGFVALSDAP